MGDTRAKRDTKDLPAGTWVCTRCTELKDSSEFPPRNNHRGHGSWCYPCKREYARKKGKQQDAVGLHGLRFPKVGYETDGDGHHFYVGPGGGGRSPCVICGEGSKHAAPVPTATLLGMLERWRDVKHLRGALAHIRDVLDQR